LEQRENVLSFFMDHLAGHGADFFGRFVGIHYYWSAWQSARDECAKNVHGEPTIQEIFEDLALIVRACPVSEILADWDYLIWEVSNARLINDHLRALELYNHAETLSLKQRPELQLIRGHFRLTVVLDDEVRALYSSTLKAIPDLQIPSLRWVAPLYALRDRKADNLQEELVGAIESLELTAMFLLGMAGGNAFDWKREWCQDAALDFSRGLSGLRELPDAYRALHARAAFLAENYHDAAMSFEQLLYSRTERTDRLNLYNSILLSLEVVNDVRRYEVLPSKANGLCSGSGTRDDFGKICSAVTIVGQAGKSNSEGNVLVPESGDNLFLLRFQELTGRASIQI